MKVAALTVDQIRALPIHQPEHTGATCGVKGHGFACLCDVHVTAPAPIRYGSNVMFGTYALQVLDDTKVSAKNFRNWAAIMLGAYDKWATLDQPIRRIDPQDNQAEWDWMTSDGKIIQSEYRHSEGRSPWTRLPWPIQRELVERYKRGDTFREAKKCLPLWVSPHDLLFIRTNYAHKLCKYRKKDQT